MANGTKEYKIVINGLTESVSAVESLNKQLDALDKRISALQAKSINIGASSGTGGSGKSSRASALSEEEKLLRQIEQTENKIKAYSQDVYQNYMASKEQLKETLNDQKQIAAQERLQANTYTNTMKGLKQQLADIKQVMQTTEIGSDIFKKYTAEANEITNKLKELEEAYGQFGRNVGNYKSAADGFKKIEIEVNGVVRSFDNARQAYKTLKNERDTMALSGQRETTQFKELDETVKTLASDIKDLSKSSATMDNLLDTMEGFTAFAGIGVGLTQLFDIDDSSFQESMQRLGALLLILKDIEVIQKQMQTGEGVGGWFKGIKNSLDSVFSKDNAEKYAMSFTKGFLNVFKSFGGNFKEEASKMFEGLDDETRLKTYKDTLEWLGDSVDDVRKKTNAWINSSKESQKITFVNTANEFARLGKVLTKTEKLAKGITTTFRVLSKTLLTVFSAGFAILLPEIIEWFGNLLKSLNTAKTEVERAAQGMNALNRQLERQRDILSSNYMKGVISDTQYLNMLNKEQADILARQVDLLQQRAKALKNDGLLGLYSTKQNVEFSGKKFSGETTVGAGALSRVFGTNDLTVTVKSIKEVEEAWRKCNKAVSEGKDLWDMYGKGLRGELGSWAVTVKDTEEVMRGLGNVRLSDIIAQFGELEKKYRDGAISAEQYSVALGTLRNALNKNDVLNSVIANLDKYIPDEGVRQAVQNIIDEIYRLDDAFNMTSAQQVHHWNQVRIDAMKDGWEKTKAQIKENQRYELQQEGHTEEQKKLIQAKYRRQYLDAQEKFGKEAADKAKDIAKKQQEAENQLIALRIANMKDGFDKRMKELDNQKRLELQKLTNDAKDNKYINVQEMTLEINKKYDKLILDEKRKWAYDILRTYEDLAERINQLNKATFDIEISNANQNVDNRARRGQSETGYQMITPTNYDDSKNLEEYYRKIVDIKKKAAEREFAIEQERLDKQLDFDKKEEELRHKRLLDENGGEYITQLRAGLISQEEYDKLIEDENDAHYARMNALDKQYASNLSAATQDSLEKTQKLYSDFYGNIVNNLRRDRAKVDEVMTKQPVTDTAGWGVVNIGKTSQNYTNALAKYDKLKQEILKKQSELEQDLKNHNISAEDFAIRQEDLKNEIKAINEACKSVKESQKMLIADFIQSMQQYIQAGMESFNTIMQALWDAQDNNFDKQQEYLDKLNDELENKLNEQKNIIQEHKDSINSIEDELATARGDRRQHLIDQLNAEMDAERAAAKEKKKIEKEQEQAQKKQDKLDQDRKKAQYQRDMLQAVVNGALAVTMAAVNAWPVPAVPMMALAAATTAAQIAIMAANKPYAKGGLLEGKSHAQGGIPIPGTGIEVEGKEYVVRKKSTAPNIDLLDYINKSERKLDLSDFIDFYTSGKVKKSINLTNPSKRFETGGSIPTLRTDIDINDKLLSVFEEYSNRPTVVQVVDIIDRTQAVKDVQVMAGLDV